MMKLSILSIKRLVIGLLIVFNSTLTGGILKSSKTNHIKFGNRLQIAIPLPSKGVFLLLSTYSIN